MSTTPRPAGRSGKWRRQMDGRIGIGMAARGPATATGRRHAESRVPAGGVARPPGAQMQGDSSVPRRRSASFEMPDVECGKADPLGRLPGARVGRRARSSRSASEPSILQRRCRPAAKSDFDPSDAYDVTIIGCGPTGQFAAFLRRAAGPDPDHRPAGGAALTAIYPEKYIYEIELPKVLPRTSRAVRHPGRAEGSRRSASTRRSRTGGGRGRLDPFDHQST